MITALICISIVLVAFLWFVAKIKKAMSLNDSFFTQIKFIQMYMSDTTEKQFYNKTKEEAIELGQDMLWSAAEDFHSRLHRAINEKQPVPAGDMGLLLSAIRILKDSEAIVFINKNGPIDYDNDDE